MLTNDANDLKAKLKEAGTIAAFDGKERDNILNMLQGDEDLAHVAVQTADGDVIETTRVLSRKYQRNLPEINKEVDAVLRKKGWIRKSILGRKS